MGGGSFLLEPKPKPGTRGTAAAVGSQVPRPAGPLLGEECQWSQQPSRCHPCSCCHNRLQIVPDHSVRMPRRRPYRIQLCGWRLCTGARETGVGNFSCLRGRSCLQRQTFSCGDVWRAVAMVVMVVRGERRRWRRWWYFFVYSRCIFWWGAGDPADRAITHSAVMGQLHIVRYYLVFL